MRLMCHRRPSAFQRCRHSARGQAQVEFSLVIVLLIVTLVSILELILLMHTYNTVADAAKEGLRYAIVHGSKNPQGIPCTSSGCTAPDIDWSGRTARNSARLLAVGYVWSRTDLRPVFTAQHGGHDRNRELSRQCAIQAKANKPPNRVQVIVAYPVHPVFGFGWPTVTVIFRGRGQDHELTEIRIE